MNGDQRKVTVKRIFLGINEQEPAQMLKINEGGLSNKKIDEISSVKKPGNGRQTPD